MATKKKSKTLGMSVLIPFAATTLSIILTFGTNTVINRINYKKERKLTALMVMSSIESFAREFEEEEQYLASIDSIATWLLSLPVDDVARLGDEPFEDALFDVFSLRVINHDKTAETIFSSNIDTWKNMGNFKFIDNVGACFASMDWMADYYNETVRTYLAARENIYFHPSDYPGKSMIEKCLRNELFRRELRMPNSLRSWLVLSAAHLREGNRTNMHLIGITEKEVMDFTDDLGKGDEYDEEESVQPDFDRPFPDLDSIAEHLLYARKIDSLLHR